jgi:hypothetical protein
MREGGKHMSGIKGTTESEAGAMMLAREVEGRVPTNRKGMIKKKNAAKGAMQGG